MYAALRLIDIAEFRRLAGFRRTEFLIALATTIAVLVVGVLPGVLVAIGLSVLDLLGRVARPHDAIEGFVPDLAGMHDVDDYPGATVVPGLMVYRYDSPLFFANTEDFRRRALAAVADATEPVQWFVLNAEAIIDIDITAVDALEDVHNELSRPRHHLRHCAHEAGAAIRPRTRPTCCCGSARTTSSRRCRRPSRRSESGRPSSSRAGTADHLSGSSRTGGNNRDHSPMAWPGRRLGTLAWYAKPVPQGESRRRLGLLE